MHDSFTDLLKSKIHIYDLVAKKVRLQRAGNDWIGLCPFHREKTGSFRVFPQQERYHCFGCGAHGDIFSFVQATEKIDFKEAVKYLADLYGIPRPQQHIVEANPHKAIYAALDIIQKYFYEQLWHTNRGADARRYLQSRNISEEYGQKFQLGYATENDEILEILRSKNFSQDTIVQTGVFLNSHYNDRISNRFRGRLIFPILDSSSRCVGFGGRLIVKSDRAKYINSPETPVYSKSNLLYGYAVARREKFKHLILTEGYLDVISLHQAGYGGAIAPLGTSISEAQIDLCWRLHDTPIICLDGDMAGIKASYRWLDKILSCLKAGKSFRFAQLPQDTDPDMLVNSNNRAVFDQILEKAVPLAQWLWDGGFYLYPSSTPEQKAAVVQTISEKLKQINDPAIRSFYQQDIFNRKRALFYPKKSSHSSSSCAKISPVMSADARLEKIFVVTLVNHPYIIDVLLEDLVKIEFKDKTLQNIIREITNCYQQSSESSFSTFIEDVRNDIKKMTDDVIVFARFAGVDSSDEDALDGARELLRMLHMRPSIKQELRAVSQSLETTLSASDWEKLKSLKKEEMKSLYQRKE